MADVLIPENLNIPFHHWENDYFCYFCKMKNAKSLPELLKSASESVKRTAHRKKIPIAISEDGRIKLIYPHKKIKPVANTSRRKVKV